MYKKNGSNSTVQLFNNNFTLGICMTKMVFLCYNKKNEEEELKLI